MQTQTNKLYSWAIQKAESPKAPYWIGLLFCLEIILFIPLDAVLMFFCLQHPKKTYLYIAIATLASTLSGLIGYLLGFFLWDLVGPYIVPYAISIASFEKISGHFQLYESWAVFVGALLPFPLKVLSLAAGVFQLGVWPFFLCFVGARLLRFSVIGGAMLLWGEKVKQFVSRHFHRIIVVIGAKIAVIFLFFWVVS